MFTAFTYSKPNTNCSFGAINLTITTNDVVASFKEVCNQKNIYC